MTGVLVVDDNPAARYALVRQLQVLGYRTAEAANGAEALRLAPSCAAVLLDVQLPDVPGTEVCKALRRAPATAAMPIIHVSSAPLAAHGLPDADPGCADAYVVAPADVPMLAAMIERLLARPRGG